MAVAASRQEEPGVPPWSDQSACHTFLSKNLGLIWGVIHRRCSYLLRGHREALRRQGEGFYTIDDAFAAGFFGLRRALERYDPAMGAFSTYAEGEIYAAIRRDRLLCPDSCMYISPRVYHDARDLMKKENLTESEELRLRSVQRILRARKMATINPEPGEGKEDASDIDPPDHDLEQAEEVLVLREAVRWKLTPTEREVYKLRYEEQRSLEDASALLGVPRQRLRSLETHLLQKLVADGHRLPGGTGPAT